MMETRAQLRLATTAIAAALAISSTALIAQDATPPDTVEPTATTPDPLALAPTTETAAPETTAAPASPTTSEAAPARPTRTRATQRAASTARPATRPAAAPAEAAPAPTVAAAEPAQALPVAEAPIAPAPPVTVEPAASRQMQMNVILAIVGAALLGLVALAAGFVALRRRKRRAVEAEEAQWQEAEEAALVEPTPATIVEPEPVRTEPAFVSPAAPAFVAAAAPATAPMSVAGASAVKGPVTELPEGFDLSRFGHNVQQAYKGPTEDNPSLSLKHRLRKAAAMDQMERNLDAEVEAATGESVLDEADPTPLAQAPAATPAPAAPAKGDFMLGGDSIRATVRRAREDKPVPSR